MAGPSMKNFTETARQRLEWCRAPIRMSYISYESSPPSGLEWGPKQLRRVGKILMSGLAVEFAVQGLGSRPGRRLFNRLDGYIMARRRSGGSMFASLEY